MAATYIRALADEGLGRSEIGGKGQSLARLVSAGLPVPNGFHITTLAYNDFIAENHLGDEIKAQRSLLTSCGPTSGWVRLRWPYAPPQPRRTCLRPLLLGSRSPSSMSLELINFWRQYAAAGPHCGLLGP